MNAILNKIIESRNGNYVHAVEVSSIYEIENIIESIASEFSEESFDTLKEFFNTISIYFLEDEELTDEENRKNEDEVYNFCTDSFIDELTSN